MNDIISAEIESEALFVGESGFFRKLMAQFGRIRVQLLVGVLVATILPAVLRGRFESIVDASSSYEASLIGTSMAFLLSFVFFRKVTSFPGLRSAAYILPIFFVGYAIVIAYFFFLRIDYSRYQFLASFILSAAWLHFAFFIARGARRLRLGVIPVGDTSMLSQLNWIGWTRITDPEGPPPNCPVVVDLRAEMPAEWERFITKCALDGRPVYNVKQVFESLSGRVHVEKLSENRFGTLGVNTLYAPAKFYFDWFLALIVLLLTWPIMLVVAIIIRLESRGPSVFKQERMGFRGRTFIMYKFRSMRIQDPEKVSRDTEMTKSNDDRITRFGRFIRKTRLDELPQLINILRGEMSWIGPRPEALNLSKWYEQQIPFYCYRHLVRPGITGWAQVEQGHITSLSDAKIKLEYDFFYVRNLSFWLDFLVVIKTGIVMFTGRGAK